MTANILDIITNKKETNQNRIDALKQLEYERKSFKRPESSRDMGVDDLQGAEKLQDIIYDRGDQVEVRCEAAAVIANTDIQSALNLCFELIERNS